MRRLQQDDEKHQAGPAYAGPETRSERRFATVLFTAIVDSTARPAEVADEAWREIALGSMPRGGASALDARGAVHLTLLQPEEQRANRAALHVERDRVDSNAAVNQIDIVYTWVDGSRPDWQARCRQAAAHAAEGMARDAATPNRSLDREELRYSLRSVAAFAAWVRHIYIVTPNQRPVWLAPSPTITVVDQDSLFPDPRHTPTFNSHAIESHIDQIPGLSEQFLYLNDDMFFARRVLLGDYFDAGRPRISFGLTRRMDRLVRGPYAAAPRGTPRPSDSGFGGAWKNNTRMLDAAFGAQQRYLPSHHALPTTKEIMARARETFAAAFNAVSSRRFRSLDDIAPIGLATYVGLHTGMALDSGEIRGTVIQYTDRLLRNALQLWAISVDHQTLCLNDDTRSAPGSWRSALVSKQIRRVLQQRFPTPAAWELNDRSP